MKPQRILVRLVSALVFAAVAGFAQPATVPVRLIVQDAGTGQLLPCRVHLRDPAGKPVRADPLPFWKDHFVCPGVAELKLGPGDHAFEIERGPEYFLSSGKIAVTESGGRSFTNALRRMANLAGEGWWSGELHVHRALADVELLMQAEDLHVAPVITWWNKQNLWGKLKAPEKLLVAFDRGRFYEVMGGEDEREGGALLYFHLPAPLAITAATREYPSSAKFLAEARRRQGAWVDIEKPYWWDVPVWLAAGVDSVGIACNHMWRDGMYETEAWGRPRDAGRLPPPRGNGYYTQELYYRMLNCGLRLPPSAGSASGVLPNPVGYNRVYVQVEGELTWDKWWEGLRAGRSFVSNGPLLRARANGRWPGHVFTAEKELEVQLQAQLTTRDPISFIEIIVNGEVERRVSFDDWKRSGELGRTTFTKSGWLLVRAVADNAKTFRFASTAPFYVEIGGVPHRVSRASAQFFLDWVRERMGRVKLEDKGQLEEALKYQREAEKFWLGKVAQANAD